MTVQMEDMSRAENNGALEFIRLKPEERIPSWVLPEIPVEEIGCSGKLRSEPQEPVPADREDAPAVAPTAETGSFEREIVEMTQQQLELSFVREIGRIFSHPVRVNTRFRINDPLLTVKLDEMMNTLIRYEQNGYRLSSSVHAGLIRWQLACEDNAKAARSGRHAVSLFPDDSRISYLYGLAQFRLGNIHEALQNASAATEDGNGDAAFLCGVCHQRQGRIPEAAVMLQKAFSSLQYHEPYLQFALPVFHEQGCGDWEARVLRSLVELHPANMELTARYAVLLYRLDRYRQAVSWFEKLLLHHPDNRELLYRIGICYANLGLVQSAGQKFRAVLQNEAHRDADLIMLLLRLQETGKGDEKIIPLIAGLFLAEARYEQCEAYCLENRARMHDGIVLVLARCYIQQERYQDVLDLAGNASVTRRHLLPDWKHLQGIAAFHTGRREEAEQLLSGAGSDGEWAAEGLALLGEIYYEKQQYREAAEVLRQAVRLGNDAPSVLSRLAWALMKSGLEHAAADIFQEIINRDPSALEALHNLGTLMAKQRQYVKAVQLFKRVLKLDPGNREANHNLGLLYRQILSDSSAGHLEKIAEESLGDMPSAGTGSSQGTTPLET